MAGVVQKFPGQPLQIMSLDYQTEREEYLRQIGALEIAHTLMMSRSVWHKVRETKAGALEGLKMPDVLPGLQPTGNPMPGRFSWRGLKLVDSSSVEGMGWDRFWLENLSRQNLPGQASEARSKSKQTDRQTDRPTDGQMSSDES